VRSVTIILGTPAAVSLTVVTGQQIIHVHRQDVSKRLVGNLASLAGSNQPPWLTAQGFLTRASS